MSNALQTEWVWVKTPCTELTPEEAEYWRSVNMSQIMEAYEAGRTPIAQQPDAITNGRPCSYCCKTLPATDEIEQYCNVGCKDAAEYKGQLHKREIVVREALVKLLENVKQERAGFSKPYEINKAIEEFAENALAEGK